MNDEQRWINAALRQLARQTAGERALDLCKHEWVDLGVFFTPSADQWFDVCRNLACRQILGEPLEADDVPITAIRRNEVVVLGDLNRTRDRCTFWGCSAVDLEQHHVAPIEWFGEVAESFGTVPVCRRHHVEIHTGLRRGRGIG